jgi:hypothetical protein
MSSRPIPEGSGAIAAWGADWSRILELLAGPIGETIPQIKRKQTVWLLHATGVGVGAAHFDIRRDVDPPGTRPIPEGSGAQACWGAGWARIVDLLGNSLMSDCPEIERRAVTLIMRARRNGLRIEFFADEDALNRREAAPFADLIDGRQIHCGGKNGILIEFFDDDTAFRARLQQLDHRLTGTVQIHAGRLTWM